MMFREITRCVSLIIVTFALNSAYALTCGQSITTPGVLNLTANLGPCPGNGLSIETSNVTINLNGFKIIGKATGLGTTGYGIAVPNGDTTSINGPGEISGFAAGIRNGFGFSATGLTVYNVTLLRNLSGIEMSKNSNALVFGNTISQGTAGIFVIESTGITIAGNAITGLTSAGLNVSNSGSVSITNNQVNNNGDGLVGATGPGGLQLRVAGNTFNSNVNDGARVSLISGGGGPIVFLGNTLNSNGNHGLNLTNNFSGIVTNIRGNTARLNVHYGIITTGDSWRVVGNNFTANMWYDIYWSGIGNACYSNNVFNINYNHIPLLPCL